MRSCLIFSFLSATSILAFQFPFKVPFFNRDDHAGSLPATAVLNKSPRIAIIGAGAGGSSAAFWISKAKERFGLDVEIDVYEKAAYVGGRSTTVHPYGNSSLPPLELGASIFVSANKNLWRASDEFNLTRSDPGEEGTTGIWDGENLIFEFGDGWWDALKIMWRYGILSPRRADSIVQNMLKKFLMLYTSETAKWSDIVELADSFDWLPFANATTESCFTSQGVNEKFVREVVEAATRVNYGQNIEEVHGLGGGVSMATNGATGIEGGNFKIFENFLKRSGAHVHLNTTVTGITKASEDSDDWRLESTAGSKNYKAVVLAAPFHSTGITLPLSLSSQIPQQPYINLHVTLLSTTAPMPDPVYFSQTPDSKLPTMILTTNDGFRNGGKEPEFNSISYHGLVREGEWAVKIFSKQRTSDQWLDKVFSGKVGWVFRKEWAAYPQLRPTTTFPPVKLANGLYYVNAFEALISTMETETVASRNVVDLLLKDQFDAAICNSSADAAENGTRSTISDEEFVYGWDC